MITMEVCVDCVLSARNSHEGGAMRIELCSALNEGGLTPSLGMLSVVKKVVDVPVFCMVRPRAGDDFAYCHLEIEAMKQDIELFKKNGVDGLVFGCLTDDRQIDVVSCKELLSVCGNLPVTFHRAFDYVAEPEQALEILIQLGFKRVLTSGRAISVIDGIDVINAFIRQANGRIIIMPGGGITEFNLARILEETNATEIHGSAKKAMGPNIQRRLSGSSQTSTVTTDIPTYFVTDTQNVKRLISICNLHKV